MHRGATIIKICVKCKSELPATGEFFHVDSKSPDKLQYSCKKCEAIRTKAKNLKLRLDVLSHYTIGDSIKCNCCGIDTIEFMAIDHINGGGHQHRKSLGVGGNFYSWLKRNNYPPGFQVLCHNCNLAKGFYGECPHVRTNQ